MKIGRFPAFQILTLLLAVTGCSKASKFPMTIPVTGVVTYNGEPVEGADVVLVTGDLKGFSAHGRTDDEGKFIVKSVMSASHEQAGAIPGTYKVRVSKFKIADSAIVTAPRPPEPGESLKSTSTDPLIQRPQPKSLLPVKYNIPEQSGLTATVEAGMEPLTLELK